MPILGAARICAGGLREEYYAAMAPIRRSLKMTANGASDMAIEHCGTFYFSRIRSRREGAAWRRHGSCGSGPGDAQELRVQPVDGIRGVGRHAYLAGAGEKRSGHGQCRPPAWANAGKMLARKCLPHSPSGPFCRASSGARNDASSFTARSLVSFMHR